MPARCDICPNNCLIKEGYFGICGVRGCSNGKLTQPYYGIISAASSDPIEKKPLYHFHPGSMIYSIGFYGCNLSCPFCQNYRISKEFGKPESVSIPPSEIVGSALSLGSFGIAYTYSEPIVHFEYMLETASLAREAGLKNVLVTNGYVKKEAGKSLLKQIDAVNIDLKSFNDNFYRKELGGSLNPVLDFITEAASAVHTELTTLVIPGKNDSNLEMSAAADFISSLDENIPWHLSAYYPVYRYSFPPTSAARLTKLAELASEKLKFVYTGNISGGYSDTYCPCCGSVLISRSGYYTDVCGISHGRCSNCMTETDTFGLVF